MPKIENYDHCLRFQVLDKVISFLDGASAEVVADNRGCICVNIDFDEQWDGVGKTARFIYNGQWTDVPLNTDNECICPSEVLKKGRFSLGVYGAELKTTTPIIVNVKASILSDCEGELPPDPTPGEYQQIMNLYQATCEAADEATVKLAEAIEAVEASSKLLVETKEELEEGGFITSLEEHNKGEKFKVWVGTTEEYKKVPIKDPCCLYLLTDDEQISTLINDMSSIKEAHALLKSQFDTLNSEHKVISGTLSVKKDGTSVGTIQYFKYDGYIHLVGSFTLSGLLTSGGIHSTIADVSDNDGEFVPFSYSGGNTMPRFAQVAEVWTESGTTYVDQVAVMPPRNNVSRFNIHYNGVSGSTFTKIEINMSYPILE